MIRERIGVLKYPFALLEAIVHRVRRSFAPAPDGNVLIEFDGQRMEGNSSKGGILGEIFTKGYHEFAATQCMKRAVKAGMTVLDVGADKGYNTLLAAKRVGARGAVHAFEPMAAARARLERNVQINGYHNVVIHDVGFLTRRSNWPSKGPDSQTWHLLRTAVFAVCLLLRFRSNTRSAGSVL